MKKDILPSFYGIMEVKHYSKNRLRLQINSLKNNFEVGKELEDRMKNLDGIYEIKSNSTIGSLLISFDEDRVEAMVIIGAILNLLGLEDEVFSTKNGVITTFVKDIIAGVDTSIYNKSRGVLDLKSAVSIALIYYGIKKVRTNPVLPNGVNLLWWAFNFLDKGGK